ncbi:sterol desaturase family protein [Pedobacter sp. SYSU D00535]|uniref:sterol desaturase family protein n=1 Tax=Pedobacter sp. SYSU D00535 TaxID=2810308 RepID=UPI001A961A88|nr:sterol desaturase family protein [Pedobacter sp. SYSU D00535]
MSFIATLIIGAEKIAFQDITRMEDTAPDLIVYAIPFMAFFTFLEIGWSWYEDRKIYKTKESIGSTLVGLGNVAINLGLKVGLLYGSVWIYNLVPWRLSLNWWTLIPCYILFDLLSYWAHRISHTNRFFWATHVVHHSAEHYNLTVAYRLSWIQNLKIMFFLPVAFAGFHPVIFFVVSQISVLFQFWVHTEYIPKLHPLIEYLFATPSNHRVHHGSQEKYLDKNYAATFIFWDRIFGTYQVEEEEPEYGLTSKIGNRMDPLFLNFHEFRDMVQDVRQAKGWKDKLFFLFGSPSAVYHRKLKDKEIAPAFEAQREPA